MIPRLHARTHSPRDPLAEALGRPLSPNEGLTEYTIVAHWPDLNYYTPNDEQRTGHPSSGPSTSKIPTWSIRSLPVRTTTDGRSSISTSASTRTTGS
ncbi:hypothetical protein ACIBW9_39800 [Streptomyces sp. NPDC049541]|uniref:hypothetical protein n=1 Tax=Streptomyces sp. NPDC049541 TaxID=3365594 RepID=UPI0037B6FD55